MAFANAWAGMGRYHQTPGKWDSASDRIGSELQHVVMSQELHGTPARERPAAAPPRRIRQRSHGARDRIITGDQHVDHADVMIMLIGRLIRFGAPYSEATTAP